MLENTGEYDSMLPFFASVEMTFASDGHCHKKSAGSLSFPRAVELKFCQISQGESYRY